MRHLYSSNNKNNENNSKIQISVNLPTMVDTSSSSDQQSRDKIVKPSTLFQQQQESGLQRKGRRFIVANRDDFLRIQFKRISSGGECFHVL